MMALGRDAQHWRNRRVAKRSVRVDVNVRRFEMRHNIFKKAEPVRFSEHDAPDWLTSKNTIKGSTMDMRWFWQGHVLTLDVGESVETDFQRITRIA